MRWPVVARRYLESFEQARIQHVERRRTSMQAKTLATRPAALPVTNLEHLQLLTDDTGVLQHAAFSVPRCEDGYCLDDNARALLLMALVKEAGEDTPITRALASRYLAFVCHAFDRPAGRFRNLMSYSREWLEASGSEDSHGRAVWALGTAVGRATDRGTRSLSGDLFHAALPVVSGFKSPRAWAYAVLGIDEYLRAFSGDTAMQSTLQAVAGRLFDLFLRSSDEEWPWFEGRVTYSNQRLSQALLVAGPRLGNDRMTRAGLRSLEWLVATQTSTDGYFSPIGSNGFYERGGARASFDQQPVEACGMVSACLEAYRLTGDREWSAHARRAFDWFLGQNETHQALYDASTGGCCDGLHADRVNANQGAESTLSFLMALVEIRSTDTAAVVRRLVMEETASL